MHYPPTEVQITSFNGTVLLSIPFDKVFRSTVVPLKRPGNSITSGRRALPDGYIAYAYWKNTD